MLVNNCGTFIYANWIDQSSHWVVGMRVFTIVVIIYKEEGKWSERSCNHSCLINTKLDDHR